MVGSRYITIREKQINFQLNENLCNSTHCVNCTISGQTTRVVITTFTTFYSIRWGYSTGINFVDLYGSEYTGYEGAMQACIEDEE